MNKDPTKQAQANHYSCQLVYLIVLSFVLYYLYLYQNPLKQSPLTFSVYILLLSTNLYLFFTTGDHPGYGPKQKQDEGELFSMAVKQEICQLCSSKKKLRMKHCYECGRCVYKFDHHCTWIGSCVGEFNHGKFWLFCFCQTIQALSTFWVFYGAIGYHPYQSGEEYDGAYGALMIMLIIMVLYSLFVGGMLLFHSYLILCNTTTYESTKFTKLSYMRNSLYPFNHGVLKNLSYVFCHGKVEPIEWSVEGEMAPQSVSVSDLVLDQQKMPQV